MNYIDNVVFGNAPLLQIISWLGTVTIAVIAIIKYRKNEK